MAVKARNRKRKRINDMVSNGIRIKCCYCMKREDCKTRESKERTESQGIVSYCSMAVKFKATKAK